MSGRLLHAGSAVVDYVYRVDALPQPGSEKVASSYAQLAGGGFNLMAAAARSGMAVAFAGRHGSGPNGDLLRTALAAERIETLLPPAADMDSGNCVVVVTADAERTFLSWPGAEGTLRDADLACMAVAAGDWVFASGYTLSYPGSRDVLAGWIGSLPHGTPLVFDPSPVVAAIPPSILSRVLARTTWLSCNAAEAAAIAGQGDSASLAAAILARHCPNAAGVVLRAGAGGCLVHLRDGTARTVPGFAVEPVDTTGAGDTHIGAFVSALSRGLPPVDAARYANAAAAIAVTRHGGASAPTDAEIRAFLALREAPAERGETERTEAARGRKTGGTTYAHA